MGCVSPGEGIHRRGGLCGGGHQYLCHGDRLYRRRRVGRHGESLVLYPSLCRHGDLVRCRSGPRARGLCDFGSTSMHLHLCHHGGFDGRGSASVCGRDRGVGLDDRLCRHGLCLLCLLDRARRHGRCETANDC